MHNLGPTLTRIGLKDGSASSQAVLRALLAVSSLHRYGLTERAVELKVSSIEALATASKTANLNGPAEIIQHIAAGMLLCSFEVYATSSTSEQWLIYIMGIRRMLAVTPELAISLKIDHDGAEMINWVLYHYCLARFTMRYWRDSESQGQPVSRRPSPEQDSSIPLPSYGTLFGARQTQSLFRDFLPQHIRCLDWMTDVADLIDERATYSELSPVAKEDYKARLRNVDDNIRQMIPDVAYSNNLAADLADSPDSFWLCSLVVVIYLYRATKGLVGDPAKVERDVAAAFRILTYMPTCNRHFFLFILAFEARSDEQRAVVLDVMARSEASSRPLNHVRLLIEAVWAQDDLWVAGQRRLDYGDKLSTVMGVGSTPPSFV